MVYRIQLERTHSAGEHAFRWRACVQHSGGEPHSDGELAFSWRARIQLESLHSAGELAPPYACTVQDYLKKPYPPQNPFQKEKTSHSKTSQTLKAHLNITHHQIQHQEDIAWMTYLSKPSVDQPSIWMYINVCVYIIYSIDTHVYIYMYIYIYIKVVYIYIYTYI